MVVVVTQGHTNSSCQIYNNKWKTWNDDIEKKKRKKNCSGRVQKGVLFILQLQFLFFFRTTDACLPVGRLKQVIKAKAIGSDRHGWMHAYCSFHHHHKISLSLCYILLLPTFFAPLYCACIFIIQNESYIGALISNWLLSSH